MLLDPWLFHYLPPDVIRANAAKVGSSVAAEVATSSLAPPELVQPLTSVFLPAIDNDSCVIGIDFGSDSDSSENN